MGLPHSLKILSCRCSIEYKPKGYFDELETTGELVEGEDLIRIRSDVPAPRQIEILLHEVIHVMLQNQQLSDDVDERITGVLSESLAQFFIDNPTFVLHALNVLNSDKNNP